LTFLKATERSFSVLQACKRLRRCSPALITLIRKRERQITLDRVDDLAKLMRLSAREKQYFKDWISVLQDEGAALKLMRLSAREKQYFKDWISVLQDEGAAGWDPGTESTHPSGRRRYVNSHILKDWLNVYV